MRLPLCYLYVDQPALASLVDEAVGETRSIEYGPSRDAALGILVGELVRVHHVELALGLIGQMESGRERADAIAGVAPHLGDNAICDALIVAQRLRDPGDRAVAVAAVAVELPQDRRRQMLEAALRDARAGVRLSRRDRRELLLSVAVSLVRGNLVAEALGLVRGNSTGASCALLLAELAPYLSTATQSAVLNEALSLAYSDRGSSQRIQALAKIARNLPEPECVYPMEQALLALNLRDDDHYSG